jgi:hypothetical protein
MTEDSANSRLEDEGHRVVVRGERIGKTLERIDPFLGPQLVVGAAILLDLSLPDKLTLGPSWLLPSFEAVLLVGLMIATPHRRVRYSPARRYIAMGLIGMVSLFNIVSLVLLSHYLLHQGPARARAVR